MRQRHGRRRSAFGEDAYSDVWTKAAALLHSVVNNHPLVDGNKRLGWLAAAVFLELNGAGVAAAGNDAVYDLATAVAASAGGGMQLHRWVLSPPWPHEGVHVGRVLGRLCS